MKGKGKEERETEDGRRGEKGRKERRKMGKGKTEEEKGGVGKGRKEKNTGSEIRISEKARKGKEEKRKAVAVLGMG